MGDEEMRRGDMREGKADKRVFGCAARRNCVPYASR